MEIGNQQERQISDLSWLAGSWDADGCFTMVRSKNSRRKHKKKFLTVNCTFTNTNIEYIEEIIRILSENNVAYYLRHIPANYSKRYGKKDMYHVVITGIKRVARFLDVVYPYVRAKKGRCKFIIQYCKRRIQQGSKHLGDVEDAIYENYIKERDRVNYTINEKYLFESSTTIR